MTDRMIAVLGALALAVTTAACDRNDEPAKGTDDETAAAKVGEGAKETPAAAAGEVTCAAAAQNVVKIMKPDLDRQIAQLPEEQRAQAQQQMAAQFNVEAITASCEQQQPSQEELACVVKAKTSLELQGCQGRPPAGHGAAPSPAPGAPAEQPAQTDDAPEPE